jgi:molecular chaperone GrpE (heat shock protein)
MISPEITASTRSSIPPSHERAAAQLRTNPDIEGSATHLPPRPAEKEACESQLAADGDELTGRGPSLPDLDLGAGMVQQLAALGICRPDEQTAGTPTADRRIVEQLDELVDDTLAMRMRLDTIQEVQGRILARLDEIAEEFRSGQGVSREIDAMRRELLGERKHLVALTAFNALFNPLERLKLMRSDLDPGRDERMRNQLDAVLESLRLVVRGLGFREFDATPGEPFDPKRMECLGYAEGTPGLVLAAVRPGYLVDGLVVRAAGVLTTDPRVVEGGPVS